MSDTMSVNDMLARLRADAADERFDGARLGPTAVRELLRHVDELAARLEAIERAEPVRGAARLTDEQIDFTEWHLAIISKLLGSPVPLEIDDIAVRLNMLIIERDAALAELEKAREALSDCATALEGYARHHAERGPEHAHKVVRNAELAARCRAALAAKGE